MNYQRAFWTNQDIKRHKCVSAIDLKSYIDYMVDHIYVTLGSTLHRQVVGISMGISCAPLLANLFLMNYEYKFMVKLEKEDIHKARCFNYTSRYIDDLADVNNDLFVNYKSELYPSELELKKEDSSPNEASYLEYLVSIQHEQFHTSLYDKKMLSTLTS